ncbi:penicillin-binding protein, partial [Reticulomyxa filosa]
MFVSERLAITDKKSKTKRFERASAYFLKYCVQVSKITVDDINNNDIFTYLNNEDMCDFVLIDKAKCKGGMQDSNGDNDNTSAINEGDKKHEKEIKALIRLFGDSINKEELKQKIINNNGNIELVIKGLVQLSVENEVYYNINNNISYCIIIDVFFILKRKRAK